MARVARVSDAPVTIRHGGITFQFDKDGTRHVTATEETILSTYQGRTKVTFEDDKKTEGSKADGK